MNGIMWLWPLPLTRTLNRTSQWCQESSHPCQVTSSNWHASHPRTWTFISYVCVDSQDHIMTYIDMSCEGSALSCAISFGQLVIALKGSVSRQTTSRERRKRSTCTLRRDFSSKFLQLTTVTTVSRPRVTAPCHNPSYLSTAHRNPLVMAWPSLRLRIQQFFELCLLLAPLHTEWLQSLPRKRVYSDPKND